MRITITQMETAIKSAPHKVENKEHRHPAPNNVVERVCDEILAAVQKNSPVILLTGETGKGKSSLLRNIGKKAASDFRLIFFNGIDFLTETSKSINNKKTNTSTFKNKNIHDFNFIKDFIYESLNLDESILILVDSADYLPADILDDFIKLTSQVTSKNNTASLILAGLPKLKYQLDDDEKDYRKILIHFSLDELNAQDIQAIASTKNYLNKPSKGALKFNNNALDEISRYIDGNQQLLDVILEWCSTLANEENVATVTKNIVLQAITSAEEFSGDISEDVENAYPPSDEIKIKTTIENQEIPLLQEDIPSIDASALVADGEYPKTTQKDTLVVNEALEIASNEIDEIDDDIMPTKWVPATKKTSTSKLFMSLAVVIVALVIGLALLITYRIQPDLLIDKLNIEHLSAEIESSDISSTESKDVSNESGILSENEVLQLQDYDEITLVENVGGPDEISSPATNQAEIISQSKNDELLTDRLIEDKNSVNTENNDEEDAELADLEQETNQTSNTETAPAEESKVAILNTQTYKIKRAEESSDQQETDAYSSLITSKKIDEGLNENEINRLLETAEQQLSIKHLTTPYEDSAYKSYQTILDAVPNHKAAELGIQRIHATYTDWANYYFRNNELKRSQHFFRKALEVNPNDQTSKNMLQNIDRQLRQTAAAPIIGSQGLSEAEKEQVEQVFVGDLLVRAKLQLQNKNLTTPPNNNAYETYQEVLRYQPENPVATAGVTAIKRSYVNWAKQDLKDSNYGRATFFYEKALAIDPSDEKLAQQLKKVKQLRNLELQN